MSKPTVFSDLQADGTFLKKGTVATISTAAAVTYTAAQIFGGLILRNTTGAGRADLMPTVASMAAYLTNPYKIAGASYDFTIRNTAGAAETITLTTNTGLTLSGTMTIAQSNSKTFRIVFTNATTATVYSLGTVVY